MTTCQEKVQLIVLPILGLVNSLEVALGGLMAFMRRGGMPSLPPPAPHAPPPLRGPPPPLPGGPPPPGAPGRTCGPRGCSTGRTLRLFLGNFALACISIQSKSKRKRMKLESNIDCRYQIEIKTEKSISLALKRSNKINKNDGSNVIEMKRNQTGMVATTEQRSLWRWIEMGVSLSLVSSERQSRDIPSRDSPPLFSNHPGRKLHINRLIVNSPMCVCVVYIFI